MPPRPCRGQPLSGAACRQRRRGCRAPAALLIAGRVGRGAHPDVDDVGGLDGGGERGVGARPREQRPPELGQDEFWPLDAEVLLNLRLGAWPQGAVLFALGVHAAGAGWLEYLPPVLVRRLGWMAGAGIVALVVLFGLELAPRDDEKLAMAADWPTMLFALLDGVIAVALTLWFVAWIQRRWPSHGALLERAGRASYATYFIHPLVLTAVMILFASVLIAPMIKFVLVAAVAIPACFAAGCALTRLPGFSEVL